MQLVNYVFLSMFHNKSKFKNITILYLSRCMLLYDKWNPYKNILELCILCKSLLQKGQKFIEIKEDLREGEKIVRKAGKYHFQCIAKRNYFIAFLDILGFTQFTQNSTLDEVYNEIQNMFAAARASRVEGHVRIGNSNNPITLSNLIYLAISDSIIVLQEVTNQMSVKEKQCCYYYDKENRKCNIYSHRLAVCKYYPLQITNGNLPIIFPSLFFFFIIFFKLTLITKTALFVCQSLNLQKEMIIVPKKDLCGRPEH